jgi:hypothetical protein
MKRPGASIMERPVLKGKVLIADHPFAYLSWMITALVFSVYCKCPKMIKVW